MKPADIQNLVGPLQLDYNGDNSKFLALSIFPFLQLNKYDKRVLRWAYGLDEEDHSYEMESDGETIVADLFLGGIIKSPAGVAHDYINRVPGHETPDFNIWSRYDANALYLRISKAIGYPFRLRYRRWLAVTAWPFWWK